MISNKTWPNFRRGSARRRNEDNHRWTAVLQWRAIRQHEDIHPLATDGLLARKNTNWKAQRRLHFHSKGDFIYFLDWNDWFMINMKFFQKLFTALFPCTFKFLHALSPCTPCTPLPFLHSTFSKICHFYQWWTQSCWLESANWDSSWVKSSISRLSIGLETWLETWSIKTWDTWLKTWHHWLNIGGKIQVASHKYKFAERAVYDATTLFGNWDWLNLSTRASVFELNIGEGRYWGKGCGQMELKCIKYKFAGGQLPTVIKCRITAARKPRWWAQVSRAFTAVGEGWYWGQGLFRQI